MTKRISPAQQDFIEDDDPVIHRLKLPLGAEAQHTGLRMADQDILERSERRLGFPLSLAG
jgi:hypothetical protein